MQIGIPRETLAGETRVAATPKTVTQLMKLGHNVVVEAGAGAKSSYPDADFEAAGATIVDLIESGRTERPAAAMFRPSRFV